MIVLDCIPRVVEIKWSVRGQDFVTHLAVPSSAEPEHANKDKKNRLYLVIWGKFYEVIYDWQANFESPGRGA